MYKPYGDSGVAINGILYSITEDPVSKNNNALLAYNIWNFLLQHKRIKKKFLKN